MNKKLRSVLIVTGVLFVVWIILNRTRVFSMVKTPSASNEPAIKTGQHFFYSSLPKPERFDFVCYTGRPLWEEEGSSAMFVHRICGMPGDVVEIRNGQLFVNGTMADDRLKVKHQYRVLNADYQKKMKDIDPDPFNPPIPPDLNDSIIVYLADKDVKELKLPAIFNYQTQPIKADSLFGSKATDWSLDNFGPLHVPAGHYFLLGDNRHASADSRFLGLVPAEKINGVVVWIP